MNIEAPNTAALERQTADVRTTAMQMVVNNPEQATEAGDFLRQLKTVTKRIDDEVGPTVKKAHEAHKSALDLLNRLKKPLLEAEQTVKRKISQYFDAEEQKRREQERLLRQQQLKMEEERRLQEAEMLERQNKHEEAAAVIEEKIELAPVVVQTAAPKLEGVATRKKWSWRVVDHDKIPHDYLMIDEKKINGIVRAMQGGTKIPGIEVYEETVLAATSY